jgi:hypothetical protein
MSEATMVIAIPEIPARESIDPKFDRAAMGLAFGWSQVDAARFAGTSDRNLRRWLQEPWFQQLVADYAQHTLYAVAARVEDLQLQALEVVADLMMNGESEQVRLKAALALLDLGPKLRDERGLQRRLAAVEQTAAAAKLENDEKDKREAGR